jgi:hypothetical protein
MLFAKSRRKTKTTEGQAHRLPRYICVVRVGINGFEGEAVLKNISAGGFLMESRTYAAIRAGERYTMRIKPEAASGVAIFELEVEVRWIQSTEKKFSAGFLVVRPPADRSFEKYVDYVKVQNRR